MKNDEDDYSAGLNLGSAIDNKGKTLVGWGKKPRGRKAPKNKTQVPRAWSAKIENERVAAASEESSYPKAIRKLQILGLRGSRDRWTENKHKRPPRPKVLALYPCTREEEELFIEEGMTAFRKNHPFKEGLKLFVPSQSQRQALKSHYRKRGLVVPD